MIYFDNAATSFPKAPGVAGAMASFLAKDAANPGRAGHRMAVAAERMLDDVRLKLTRLFDGEDHHRMVFALNCTDALNMAIKGVVDGLPRDPAPHVITTNLEHNSVSRPLQALADSGRIALTRVAADAAGFVDPADIADAVGPTTRLIVMTHASNVLGTIQDAAAVGAIARERGVLFCLDVAQTAGLVPISVKAMHIDLLAFPGHKGLLGPTGTGGLYVGPRCPTPESGELRPWREGGTGGDSSTPTQPPLFPYYLEGGTPNTVGVAGLGAGVDYVLQHTPQALLAHEQQMVQKIIDHCSTLDGRVTLYGEASAARRVGTVSINLTGYDAPDAGSILDDSFAIATRPGLHCAPYIHRALGTFPVGALRLSPGPFNTDEELDALVAALSELTAG